MGPSILWEGEEGEEGGCSFSVIESWDGMTKSEALK